MSSDVIDIARIRRAQASCDGVIRRTPVLESGVFGRIAGGVVMLKAENLQRTGAFKLRGALARIATMTHPERGVVTGSAGNHAQALAAAARLRGAPCEVVMPVTAPVAKAEACAAYGARVVQVGASLDEAMAHARELADRTGATFVHPFDDPEVIAGQGTIGLEIAEQVPDAGVVVLPVGGGGLIGGVATALRALRPDVRIVGVQAAACPGAMPGGVTRWPPVTLADGIAVKHPSPRTAALIDALVDDLVTVDESAIAEAISLLLGRAKLLVEGAGAVSVAALLTGAVRGGPRGPVVAVCSGGNIDPTTLNAVVRREETRSGRRLVLTTRVDDRPGHLAELLRVVGEAGGNLLEVNHLRDGVELAVRMSAIELVLETRGQDHSRRLLRALTDAGYTAVPRMVAGS